MRKPEAHLSLETRRRAGSMPPISEHRRILARIEAMSDKIDREARKEEKRAEEAARPGPVERDDIVLAGGNGRRKPAGMAGRVIAEPMPVAFPETTIPVRPDSGAGARPLFLGLWNAWTVPEQIEEAARRIVRDDVRGIVRPLPGLAGRAEIIRIRGARRKGQDLLP